METTVSHYELIEKLGQGGMGMVYKAEDTRLNRTVALKFLSPELMRDEEAKKRFIYEAQAASSLQHSNICTIHDIDESEEGNLFISMDYYEGETLDTMLTSGPMKVDLALDIAGQIATGLGVAHEHGIIHRDIKPSNVMVTRDGTVKILDFGLAKVKTLTAVTKSGETLGTAGYMSPEQAGGGKVDHRTDIWALGVVLYEMITGRLPFKAEYEQAMIYSILNDSPEPPTALRSGIPKELDRVLLKALSKEPSERYQHMDDMIVDIRKLSESAGSTDQKDSLTSARRRKKMFYSALSALLVVIASVIVWTFISQRSELKEKSRFIAVLPFDPITNSEEDRFFAEGIHDDILTQLSKISGLRVIAKTSVIQYRNSTKPIKEIADELGVGTILEGSTRRSGNMVRVTAQLIDAETEEHLWAESFDRPYNDIFAIQSAVAREIASALQVKLKEEELKSIEGSPTGNLEAYEYFKKGLYYWARFYNYDGNLKAANMFEQACSLDSGFALAWAWQARAYAVVAMQSPTIDNWDSFVDKSRKALVKAESLDPDMPEVNMARADIYFAVEHQLEPAIREVEKANLKRPNDKDILYNMGIWEGAKRNWQKSYELSKKIIEIDPKGTGGLYIASRSSFGLGHYAESISWADRMISMNPELGTGYALKIHSQLCGFGDLTKAEMTLEESKKLVTGDKTELNGEEIRVLLYKREYGKALAALDDSGYPQRFLDRAQLLLLLGRESEAMQNYDSAKTKIKSAMTKQPGYRELNVRLAIANAGLGNKAEVLAELSKIDSAEQRGEEIAIANCYILIGMKDKALEFLASRVEKTTGITPATLRLDPRLDPIRSDPRFEEIVARSDSRANRK